MLHIDRNFSARRIDSVFYRSVVAQRVIAHAPAWADLLDEHGMWFGFAYDVREHGLDHATTVTLARLER